MIQRLRRHFNATTVIAVFALVFAMTGGAYAAKKYLINSTSQISPKVLKSLRGKAGVKGANGANGAAGAQGPAGPAGPQGPGGAAGTAGAKGENGAPGAPGAPGKDGKEGSPWTAGGVLPSGKTETGSWAIQSTSDQVTEEAAQVTAVSFPIPLANALSASSVTFVPLAGETPEEEEACPGSVETPLAKAGNFCVYTQSLQSSIEPVGGGGKGSLAIQDPTQLPNTSGASTSGALLYFTVEAAARTGRGTWAVTAP